ncbi:DUF4290 domain-containing protein [Sphingobacterium corticibacter]|uniref:DUF4290 domain-containing protein n=1 Tax=Sphingobacterium corticibacter TaxID=2171749 RepID=A0A2T8HEV7_9SPHI|nr:DUF4290 domain-containing protein [Sphingobacterium corticibacter]PVH23892.1 DUF4290 domain-containing protein [Sphingobacterium corticibacter]
MNFDYNSTRSHLILAEYGRNVQNMVDYICTISDREERNRLAQVVIDMMGVLNPHLRDVSDFKHKLWDHLYIISDFKIDVDSPYPIPERGQLRQKPETLAYPQKRIRYKHYGRTVEDMINKAIAQPEPEYTERMALSIANFMKMAYLSWNKDSVSDEHIIQDLKELSKGALTLPSDTVLTKLDFKSAPPGSRTKTSGSSQQSSHQKNAGGGKKPMMKKKVGGGGYSNNKSNNNSNYNNNRKKFQ